MTNASYWGRRYWREAKKWWGHVFNVPRLGAQRGTLKTCHRQKNLGQKNKPSSPLIFLPDMFLPWNSSFPRRPSVIPAERPATEKG
jgi:hypothetical protein